MELCIEFLQQYARQQYHLNPVVFTRWLDIQQALRAQGGFYFGLTSFNYFYFLTSAAPTQIYANGKVRW